MAIRAFTIAEIKKATKNFQGRLLGEGSFAKVYEGHFEQGAIDEKTTSVAVKWLNPLASERDLQFAAEINILSEFRHRHIVPLLGYCDHSDNHNHELIIVYELMPGRTVFHRLFNRTTGGGSDPPPPPLSWVQRLNICIGAADGLNYIHTSKGTNLGGRVIHRDVKSSNILLNQNLEAKVADFGLVKLTSPYQSYYIGKMIRGTIGYIDPTYFKTGRLTSRSDVYSFGVVMLEILCGRPAIFVTHPQEQQRLTTWANPFIQTVTENQIRQITDDSIVNEIQWDSLEEYVKLVNHCLHEDQNRRPSMLDVVAQLRNILSLQQATN